MDTDTVSHLLSKMEYVYEVQSDKPGITFDDGFKKYDELPKPSEMLQKLDNDK